MIAQTTDQKAALYSPLCWGACEETPGEYVAQNFITGDAFTVHTYLDGTYRVWNEESGHLYEVDQMLGCSCPDFEHRAFGSRLCKHGCAVVAVERTLPAPQPEPHQPAAAERKAIARADIESLGL